MKNFVTIKLFDFNFKNQLIYIHWKSNQHLTEALLGKTDLDILVHEKEAEKFKNTLSQFNFKKVISPTWKQYPGISDWIGFDYNSGTLLHIHLHYKLIIGQKNIKNIHLPLENWLLTNTRTQENIKAPQYEKELIILIIRTLIKTTWKQIFLAAIKRKQPFPNNIKREFDWLLKYTDTEILQKISREIDININSNFFIDFINRFTSNTLSPQYMFRAKTVLKKTLKPYQRKPSYKVILQKMWLMTYLPSIKVLKIYQKKTFPNKGLYFAIVGCDGSGKTTISEDLQKWLSWKIAVKHVYFGIPKKSLFKKLITVCRLSFIALSKIIPVFKYISNFLDDIWWLYLAHRRKRLHKICIRYRNKGYVVIAERFPLQEFWEMEEPMDGPRIKQSSILSKWEKRIYQNINLPNKVFILQVGINELRKRKDNLELTVQNKKANAVNSITPKKNYYLINAEKPYQDVLIELKRLIWKNL